MACLLLGSFHNTNVMGASLHLAQQLLSRMVTLVTMCH